MQLYVLRHGIAEERPAGGADSAERALTHDGIVKMEAAARGMRRLDIQVDRIISSPLRRARQTAEIVAAALGQTVMIEPALAPGFAPAQLEPLIERYHPAPIMLVGHEPDLSLITSALIGGGQIQFKKGGLALISISADREVDGILRWLLPPGVLRAIAER